jgi:DNA phosphorothioation-associated putative methyltransferase
VERDRLAAHCAASAIGKRLPSSLYVHHSAIAQLDPELQALHTWAIATHPDLAPATLLKIDAASLRLSYLHYPDFDRDPHPALTASSSVQLTTGDRRDRHYQTSPNPYILHRKETFVAPDYPLRDRFAALTAQEDAAGLLKHPQAIGTRRAWENRMQAAGWTIRDHQLVPLARSADRRPPERPRTIDRHRAAIARTTLSRPVRLALEAGLVRPGDSFFDYGCGRGSDQRFMAQAGYASAGWDPYYCPDQALQPANVVNLGYVINVIETVAERQAAVEAAWALTQDILIVSAQVTLDSESSDRHLAYGDGIVTSRNTFQKYFDQEELKRYLEDILGVEAHPAALGVFFVFRDRDRGETFKSSRFRSRATTPRIARAVARFEDYQALLAPLMDFMAERGRLPVSGELSQESEICAALGTLRRAWQLVLQATTATEWEAIAQRRRQELALYLALTHFETHRPTLGSLPPALQTDIRALFGSYRQACAEADAMLFGLGDPERITATCRASAIGQQRPHSLWIHISALDQLDPMLRLYEACASRTFGRMDEAAIVKLHCHQPRVSYYHVPNFDRDPHPAIAAMMQVNLQGCYVRYRDFDPDNPPLLHQKHQLLTPDYPHYAKFAKLSQQEHHHQLLDHPAAIYDRRAWERLLLERCVTLQGHRLVWRKESDEQQRKVLQAAVRRRQREYQQEHQREHQQQQQQQQQQ